MELDNSLDDIFDCVSSHASKALLRLYYGSLKALLKLYQGSMKDLHFEPRPHTSDTPGDPRANLHT